MTSGNKNGWSKYAAAVLWVVLTIFIRWLLWPMIQDRMTYLSLLPAVVVSAWYGGFGPGMLAAILGGLASSYFIQAPRGSFIVSDLWEIVGLAVYMLIGTQISWLSELQRRSSSRLQAEVARQTAELRQSNEELRQQASERLAAEEDLKKSEAKYRLLVDEINDGYFITDKTGTITFANQALAQIMGFKEPAEVLGTFAGEYVSKENHARIINCLKETVKTRKPILIEHPIIRKGGYSSWVELKSIFMVQKNRVVGTRGMVRDITTRRKAEEQMTLQSAALKAAANAIVISDVYGNVFWVNDAFARLTGYSAEEAIGQQMRFLRSGQHPQSFYDHLWKTILAGKVWQGEIVNRRKDSDTYTEMMTITPVRGTSGSITHFIAIKEDLTERRLLEKQLWQSQKLEAIGKLAGGVAHDFNNILSVIIGYSDLLLDHVDSDSPYHTDLEEIRNAGTRAAALTQQLLAFGRKQVLSPVPLDLNAVISNTEKMLQRMIGEDIDLVSILDPQLAWVKVDPSQIEQVIINLAINARDAMPTGGKLTIETANVELDEEYARRHIGSRAGPHVMLSVSDTGCGMDAETQSRVFEPFFTTKKAGEGTGLGLSTVYGIVKQHGGNIWVYSEVGKGTAFKIYLPQAKDMTGVVSSVKDSSIPHGGNETILLVEDESAVRRLAARILENLGYRVLEAADGQEALAISELHQGPIHLMVTDVIMPGMSGRELASRLTPVRTQMKVLYLSGYTQNSIARHGILDPGIALLEKPFTPDSLAAKVRAVLDTTP